MAKPKPAGNFRSILMRPPVFQTYGKGVTVLRDDLLYGGSKSRFLPYLVGDAEEIVFGGPFCGGAPIALAYLGKLLNRKITLFFAKRNRENWHPRQVKAKELGAILKWVPDGMLTVVQKRARDYAEAQGALFLPLGFDLPAAEDPFLDFIHTKVRKKIGDPDEIWCATSSGMLARCLGKGFPNSHILSAKVGLKSRHAKQPFTNNVELLDVPYRFEQRCKVETPFPCCYNYERKAWELMQSKRKGSALFWNVIGD